MNIEVVVIVNTLYKRKQKIIKMYDRTYGMENL